MKLDNSSFELMKRLCGEVREDDGVDPREFRREKKTNRSDKRDRQLAAQVKRRLDLSLPEMLLRFDIARCEVESVEPAPDASRLLVVIGVDADRVHTARDALAQINGRLRFEVSRAVCRKKTPELSFTVVGVEENWDEERRV